MRLEDYLKRAVYGNRLLSVDEIGYLPPQREDANPFFQVMSARYEKCAMISSNLGQGVCR